MTIPDFSSEIRLSTARSGGSGGQNVNKVETMVEGRWMVAESAFFDEMQKQTLFHRLANRITSEGYLLVRSQQDRTQLGNKALVIRKMHQLIADALTPVKPRIASKPTKASRLRNREVKQLQSARKTQRRWRPGD